VKLLSGADQNVFVVGDEDQSIYSFRGSDPGIMMRFESEFTETKLFKLETNYRSTKTIVEGANNLIRRNKLRFDKNMVSFSDRDSILSIKSFRSGLDEAEYVARMIQDKIAEGYKTREIAVLYRNNNRVSLISSKLESLSIPFNIRRERLMQDIVLRSINCVLRISGQTYNRGDIFLLLKMIDAENYRYLFREEEVDFDRILNTNLISEEKKIILRLQSATKLMAKLEPFPLMVYMERSLGFEEFLRGYCKSSGLSAEASIERFQSFMEIARGYKYAADYMEAINDGESHELLRTDGVALKTFHASKGLEYKVVFIIDALEGITPSNKALAQGNLEEERRMFYVALTRAKRECYICFPNQIGEKCYKKSRFIDALKIL
jgi:DNA helicase-2/ATP-dependent DNA helicase PcrA